MAASLMRRNLFGAFEPSLASMQGWFPAFYGFIRSAIVTPPNTVHNGEWRRRYDPFRFSLTLGKCLLDAPAYHTDGGAESEYRRVAPNVFSDQKSAAPTPSRYVGT